MTGGGKTAEFRGSSGLIKKIENKNKIRNFKKIYTNKNFIIKNIYLA